MSFRIESAGKSDVGNVREKNEDSLVIDVGLGLYAVCDGMGGHVGGQVASQTAVATLLESLQRGEHEEGVDPMVTAILRANRKVPDVCNDVGVKSLKDFDFFKVAGFSTK